MITYSTDIFSISISKRLFKITLFIFILLAPNRKSIYLILFTIIKIEKQKTQFYTRKNRGTNNMRFLRCKTDGLPESSGKKISIIGSGPAGLGAAGVLVCHGHEVHIYEMHPEPGGLLIFGIPDFRIKKDLIRKGINELKQTGRVFFHTNTMVGKDIDLEEIISSSDAVLIATGTTRTRNLSIPGVDAIGVYGAVEWIIDYYRLKFGYKPIYHNPFPELEEPVGIIGAGLTACDIAHVAKGELGKETYVIYRRTREETPMGKREIEILENMGVKFLELLMPKEIKKDSTGHIESLICYRTKLGGIDETGRPRFIVMENQVVEIKLGSLFPAIGPLPTPPFGNDNKYGIKINPNNTIYTDEKFRTTRKGVFAAGDVRHGSSLIGPALKSGIDAAKSIIEYLETGKWF